jgi:uncharacterized membrane protein HdeD (DUF308 family)
MTSEAQTTPATPAGSRGRGGRRVRGLLLLFLGCLAIVAQFYAGELALFLGGILLIVCGALEMLETFQVADDTSLRATYLSGELSILTGILLLSTPELVLKAVTVLVAGMLLLDGLGRGIGSLRAALAGRAWAWMLTGGTVRVGLGLVLATGWPVSGWPVVGVVIGIHILMSGWSMLLGRDAPAGAAETGPEYHPDPRLGLPAHAAFAELNAAMKEKEEAARPVNARWCWLLIVVFFAIHFGRMRVYWTPVGIIDPLVAVAGNVAIALVLAFCVILPVRLAWRKLTRPLERRGWRQALAQVDADCSPGLVGRLSRGWLAGRMRFARSVRQMRHSSRAALGWGLRTGLPVVAVLVAVAPIWGLNYFFNTETWASAVWQRWARARTDTWRENMIVALRDHYHGRIPEPDKNLFRVEPPGVKDGEDFSFLVIGDNGDGSAAQHSLRAQYLELGKRKDVQFMVISSDVIYPAGAMRDYEAHFYLPFMGFTKPIYAIPGNHDWYDALEGFAANFLEEDAARICMISRLETDYRLSTTTEGRIEGYIQEAARLRKEFGVKTGLQRGPIFEVQTDRFALIAADTGVLKTLDSAQADWFKAALRRAKGKFIMVLLGHPLFTGGRYQADPEAYKGEAPPPAPQPLEPGETKSFTALHHLLKQHQVDVVMAGDMHYFETYQEPYKVGEKSKTMHHFVNGGGGAYMVVGLPFDWPQHPDAPADPKAWSYFPRKDAIITKLDAQTPFWKMPLWLWVKHAGGWPFSGYILSAAFDHTRAPFFQSFVEVQVRNKTNEVAFIPHGATGPLRWRDLENFQALMPVGKTENDPVEFIIKMPRSERGAAAPL